MIPLIFTVTFFLVSWRKEIRCPIWYLAVLFYVVMKSCLDQDEQWAVLKKIMSDLSATLLKTAQRSKFQVEFSSSVCVNPADVDMMTDAHLQL